MSWTLPNFADTIEYPVATGVYPQAMWDKVDGDILNDNAGIGGVSSGCAVTQRGAGANQSVDVASGTVVLNNTEVAVGSGNVAAASAHATLPRFDLVLADSSGVKSILAGTAATTPVFPALGGKVALAALFRRPLDDVIDTAEIVDKRRVVRSPLSAAGWTTVSKGGDQTKTTDTTFANDSALTFALAASTKYRIRGNIDFHSEATPDIKWQLNGPAIGAGLIMIHWETYNISTGLVSTAGFDSAYATSHAIASGAIQESRFHFEGILHNGVTAGTFAFQWAQNTSDAGATTVRAGSYLEYSVA